MTQTSLRSVPQAGDTTVFQNPLPQGGIDIIDSIASALDKGYASIQPT